MWKWIIGGAAALYVGPIVLRKLAKNPQLLDQGASLLDETRAATERTLARGAKAAAAQSEKLLKDLKKRKGLGLAPVDHANLRRVSKDATDGWVSIGNTLLMSPLPRTTKCEQASVALDQSFYNYGMMAGHSQDKTGNPIPAARSDILALQTSIGNMANTFRELCVTGGSGRMPRITGYGTGTPVIRF